MPGLGKSGTSRMSFFRSIVSRSFSYNTAAGVWLGLAGARHGTASVSERPLERGVHGRSLTLAVLCRRPAVIHFHVAHPTSRLICDKRVHSGGFVKLFAMKLFAGVALAGLGLLLAQPPAPQIPKIKFSDRKR